MELRRAVNVALQGLSPKTTASLKSKLFWTVIASFRLGMGKKHF